MAEFFDVHYRLRTDPAFSSKVKSAIKKLVIVDAQDIPSDEKRVLQKHACNKLISLCGGSPALTTRYYFPVSYGNVPLSFVDYPLGFYTLHTEPELTLTVMGSRQITKSVSLASRQIINGHRLHGYSSIYVAPHPEHTSTYSKRLDEIYNSYRFKAKGTKDGSINNRNFKRFWTRSTLELVHVWEDDTKIRGKTADELLFDEYQNFDIDFLGVIDEVIAASKMRNIIRTGTSLTTETALNHSFINSSQGYFHVICEHCQHEHIPLLEHGIMDIIQPRGPTCIKCGKPLNVRRGFYVHHYPERLTWQETPEGQMIAPHIGVHASQIFTPAVVGNPARWRALYNKKITASAHRFTQENLGLPTEEGFREITEAHLRACCLEDDGSPRKGTAFYQNATRDRKRYKYIISGADWGGSDHNRSSRRKVSTTVHAVVGVTYSGKVEVIYFKRYDHMDYAGIADDIITNHYRLSAKYVGSDFGVGYYYNDKLRTRIPERFHLIFHYQGPRTKYIRIPPQTEMVNHYQLNKTESISALFDAIRARRILFYRWEESQPFLNDFLQIYRNVHESDNGPTTFTFRSSASTPNDALQAVNYAYVIARILMDEDMFDDQKTKNIVQSTLMGVGGAGGVDMSDYVVSG